MSFFDDASLAFLPSGGAGKDTKAYSIKPTDGSGDFTFSRGSNLAATRVGPTGLIEKGRENLLLQSNNFGTTWTQSGTTITSGQSGYDGSSDAWEIARDGASGLAFIYQTISTTGVVSFSIYAKANTEDWIYLQDTATGGVGGYFDLANGVSGSTFGIDTSIEPVSGATGWYRITMAANRTTSGNIRIFVASGNGNLSVTGSIYIQDAQMEIGLAATDYIESGATTGKAGLLEDEPRFDYSGGATCPSLLLEPSRTNIIPQSEYLNGISALAKIGTSFDTNVTTSPEGLDNASLLKEDSSNGSHFAYIDFALTNGSTYTISIFAKAGGVNRNLKLGDGGVGWGSGFNGQFDLTAGTATGGTIEPMGSGWYRCSVTGTTNATSSRLIIYSTLNTATSYQGDGTSGVYLYGFQLEEGSYPTSYIPNHSGGSVTRGADDCITLGLGSIAGQSEGTLFAYFETIGDSGTPYISLNQNNGVANRVLIYNNSGICTEVRLGGTKQAEFTTSTQGLVKVAIAYKENDFAFYINGSQIGTDTSGSTFGAGVLNELNLGFGNQDGAEMKQVLLFDTRLSNTDLATLTTL